MVLGPTKACTLLISMSLVNETNEMNFNKRKLDKENYSGLTIQAWNKSALEFKI